MFIQYYPQTTRRGAAKHFVTVFRGASRHISGPMVMRRSWIAACALLAAGCAPLQWAKSDATPEQLAVDTQQCEQAAWREANYYYAGYRPFGPWMYRDAYGGPYFHTVGPFYNPYYDGRLEEQRLADFCMRAKGYELAPEGK